MDSSACWGVSGRSAPEDLVASDSDGITGSPAVRALPGCGGASRDASPKNVEETESADTFVIAQVYYPFALQRVRRQPRQPSCAIDHIRHSG
jgi:hypothetical protein